MLTHHVKIIRIIVTCVFVISLFCFSGRTAAMEITSQDFKNNQPMPVIHTCDGNDVSPQFSWSGAPAGIKESENDFGKKSYGGPCPPSGTHRYVFTVYALKKEKMAGVTKDNFLQKVKENQIAKALLTGLYKRR